MYAPPPVLETRVYARLPDELRKPDRSSDFIRAREAGPLHSFLEGPSFDRAGNLYCVDIAHGRIFWIAPDRTWSVFAEYDGEPNGLKIHRDGRIFVTDAKRGVLCFDPVTSQRSVVIDRAGHEPLHGTNDLVFASNGDLFFTDPGYSDFRKPTGRVFRLRSSGELDLLIEDLPLPNGLVLNREENLLYVALTRTNQVISVPLRQGYAGVGKCGVLLNLSGSPTGPDGMALDKDGNLVVVHAGFGTVWVFSRLGEPVWRIKSCAGMRTTNVAYGGPDHRTLFITEAEQGVILQVELPVPGQPMYAHLPAP